MKDEDEEWLEDREQVKELAVSVYKKLFRSNRVSQVFPQLEFSLPSLRQEDNQFLEKLPIFKELKEVVCSLSWETAPGSDGFGVGFYQECWDTICEDLLQAVHDFFHGAQ